MKNKIKGTKGGNVFKRGTSLLPRGKVGAKIGKGFHRALTREFTEK